jgi:ActR/RegA family two-component response regulator
MTQAVRILFVDDEPGIRTSLSAVLTLHGFAVTSAASVGEAVQAIAAQPFDVLISDLNIGSPGDGFTVVSAMRRTQPSCVTLILTGYPAFETALQAIRSQVDDYLIKPAGVQELVTSIEDRLLMRRPHQVERLKRVPQIVEEQVAGIVSQIVKAHEETARTLRGTSDEEEFRHRAGTFIRKLARQMMTGKPQLTPEMVEWSRQHGVYRSRQGYSAEMLVEENRIVCAAVLDCIHNNLLIADVSQLIPDLKLLSAALSLMLREAIGAHEEETISGARKLSSGGQLRKSG